MILIEAIVKQINLNNLCIVVSEGMPRPCSLSLCMLQSNEVQTLSCTIKFTIRCMFVISHYLFMCISSETMTKLNKFSVSFALNKIYCKVQSLRRRLR